MMTPVPGTDPGTLARFMAKVNVTDGCWLWTAGQDGRGYGRLMLDRIRARAHRFSWTFFRGRIPDSMCVLHRCDVRPCVNPEHLFLGTKSDNTADMDAKGRRVPASGNKHGSRTKPWRVPRGADNGNAKLNDVAVRVARLLASRGVPAWKIGAAYGVSRTAVALAVRRVTWGHVA